MAATATAAALLQTAEAQVLKDAIQSAPEASAEEISAKLASNREQKLKQANDSLIEVEDMTRTGFERFGGIDIVFGCHDRTIQIHGIGSKRNRSHFRRNDSKRGRFPSFQ